MSMVHTFRDIRIYSCDKLLTLRIKWNLKGLSDGVNDKAEKMPQAERSDVCNAIKSQKFNSLPRELTRAQSNHSRLRQR